jgi:hypothetical protein
VTILIFCVRVAKWRVYLCLVVADAFPNSSVLVLSGAVKPEKRSRKRLAGSDPRVDLVSIKSGGEHLIF